MKLAAVILNYNDALTTLEAVRRAIAVPEVGAIVVVDNASTDDSIIVIKDSMEWLKKDGILGKNAGKLSALIRSPKNGGYGSGNNIGVRYAAEHFKADYCLIANPDAEYRPELISRMLQTLEDDSNAALIGAVARDGKGTTGSKSASALSEGLISYDEFICSGWKKRNLAEEIIYSAPIMKRIFKKAVNYPEAYYRDFEEAALAVHAVHGSLMVVDTAKFAEVGGFDEEFFLYMEESVLAKRLERRYYRTYLLKWPYIHRGSHSISGVGYGVIRRQRQRQRSERLYYRKYMGAGLPAMCLVSIIQTAVLAETAAYALLTGIYGHEA